jgi:hypothetical protein
MLDRWQVEPKRFSSRHLLFNPQLLFSPFHIRFEVAISSLFLSLLSPQVAP